MVIGNYPITHIKCRASSLADFGYKVWFWQLEGGAYDCPLEPLTQEFWQTKKNARLAYGVLLLTLDAGAPGDLLILATQDLNVTFDQGYGQLTIPQFLSLHRAILRLNFPQVDILRSLQFEDRLDLFKELETAFAGLVLPRKNEKGEYYRRLHKLEAFDNSQTDNLGVGFCPRCKQGITFGKGLDVMKAYRIDPETVFVFGTGGNTMADLARGLKAWGKGDAYEMEGISLSETEYVYNITRCRYAEMYKAIGMADLGAILSCGRDFELIAGFNPKMKLTRTKTIMEGCDCCDFRITLLDQ